MEGEEGRAGAGALQPLPDEPVTSDAAATDQVATADEAERVQELLDALSVAHSSRGPKRRYAFWETQPVAQFSGDDEPQEDGPIDVPKTVADVRQEPYGLPPSFEWCECNISDATVVREVYELLAANYVEDDDAMFRFDYSKEFLIWALQPPGFRPEWHIGVRVSGNRKLVGFITAVPATVRVRGREVPMVEINFLCVHKKLRSKRLAPVLIKEVTRRVNLCDIWQAAYTAGVVIPKPVAETQYWHRSINPRKLNSVGFSKLSGRMTLARTIKLYRLPDTPATPGLRRMQPADVPQVTALLSSYLSRYQLAPVMGEADVAHWLLPREDVVDAYVGVDGAGAVTDLLSFYTLPSSVLGNAEYNSLKAAYMYYTVPGSVPLSVLLNDALICARDTGHDVFNALDVMENKAVLKDLKFGIGDGKLQYYLYNWRLLKPMTSEEVGLILL